jgi:hypothetical protein
MRIKLFGLLLALLVPLAMMALRVGGARVVPGRAKHHRPLPLGLEGYLDSPPQSLFDLVFIHHSVGGALLADPGPRSGPDEAVSIFESHPSGAGLRHRLELAGYRVHEASYGSIIGQGIDMFDWLPKFRDQMERVLHTEHQDQVFSDGRQNRVVVFETCFNSNWFKNPGVEPGNPNGPELTVANAKAVFRELRQLFAQHPDVLFVHLTAAPLAPQLSAEPLYKFLARKVLRRPTQQELLMTSTSLARQFNDWLSSEDGWLSGYPSRNVVVFDFYDLLTGHGQTNALLFPTDAGGFDSHPNRAGLSLAADELIPFLNRAVRRSGIVP